MITIADLKKSFGETIACDIPSLTINDGDILGLVGNNGAGKTTLFRMMLDLLKPDAGEVALDAVNPAESEDWKASTGAYIDEGFLIDFLTPEEYFAFIGKITNMTQEAVDERLKDFEKLAGGEIFGQKKLIRNLSAGNKQKVGIMSALFNRPNLKHELTEYNRETRATILISSHNLQHTVDISTRITLLEKGHIIKDMSNENGSARAELENYFDQDVE